MCDHCVIHTQKESLEARVDRLERCVSKLAMIICTDCECHFDDDLKDYIVCPVCRMKQQVREGMMKLVYDKTA